MDKESKPLTTFTMGPLGFYEYERIPFRLTNAPTTFQRLMETCLGDPNLHWCVIYLDNIVIFSKDLASHLERLEAVFQKLEESGLKLKPSKWELFWWDCLLGASDLCLRNSHWWGQDRSDQKVANPNKLHGGSKFSGIHRILQAVFPKIYTGSQTPAWVNFGL